MATVILSSLISSIKGSINGSTFQRSGSGLTLRNKPINVGKGTNAQNNIKTINSRLNFAWLNLTDEQRNIWAAFSSFTNGIGKTNNGVISSNTGKTQFFAVNFWCLQYGKDILTTPTFTTPEEVVIPCPPYFNISTNLENYTGSIDVNTQILVTKVSLPQSLSTNTANTGFRTLIYDQVNGSQQSWFSAYQNTFGILPVTNKRYWISLQVVNFITGAISPETKQLVLYSDGNYTGVGYMQIGTTNIIG